MKRLILFLSLSFVAPLPARGEVRREMFSAPPRYLAVEILDDRLVHFELGEGLPPSGPIYATPMVEKRDFPRPDRYRREGNVMETSALRISVEPGTLCAKVRDLERGTDLTRICGESLNLPDKRLLFDALGMKNVYGIGNFFFDTLSADGDWIGRELRGSGFGNIRKGFSGSDPSMSQFPVFYALGKGRDNYALFFDDVYRQSWDFRDPSRWSVESSGDRLRWYLIAGRDLKELRRTFMDLTGKPPVPDKSLFGLWVSKFGYLNWDDIRLDLESLRKNRFPVDGFALDIQWFGGTFSDYAFPRMGSLTFDEKRFPDPAEGVARLKRLGVRLMLIEEPYIDDRLPEFRLMIPPDAPGCYLARREEAGCDPVRFGGERTFLWWGRGGMIDYTNPAAGIYWHLLRRADLSALGVTSHWADLGEPEMYDPNAWYYGLPGLPGKNRHQDIHNLYSFFWAKSIADGYGLPQVRDRLAKALSLPAPPRHFVMSRAGAPGMQRSGSGMWSGDIGRNMGSLRAHLNTQMHMSLAGIDYYNSDVGGFLGTKGLGIEPGHTDGELYTQWFADSALGEIPLRPHGWSYVGEIPTFGPDRQGHRPSNRANLLLRYELFPYVYSLAHRAWREGEPIFPPLVYHFQEDEHLRTIGNTKMIGPWLLYGVAVGFAQTERRLYLPKGRWVNYHTGEWLVSRGEETPALPLYLPGRKGSGDETALTLPLFVRGGALIPIMATDDRTLDIAGMRSDGTRDATLRVQVFPDSSPTSFTLFEDDGETIAYQGGGVRETIISQQGERDKVTVRIAPSKGEYAGAPVVRDAVITLRLENARALSVELNGSPLPPCRDGVSTCWEKGERGSVVARTGMMPVSAERLFVFRLEAVPATASVHFVCDSDSTQPGEALYVTGNIPRLGSWDPARALRLEEIRYPRWVRWVDGLPPKTVIEWRCLKKDETGVGKPLPEPGPAHTLVTPESGFADTGFGTFKR